jgi:hypothetical protein
MTQATFTLSAGVVEVSVPGPRGPQGTAGADGVGSEWLQGIGVPSAGLGSNGDFYLDTATGDIYGPKVDGAWGAVIFNIAEGQQGPAGIDGADGADGTDGAPGADGADGADGLSVLSGAGAPDAELGVDGEFYIDTVATAIYGPKTAGVWGSPTSLIGADGADGALGADGADGLSVLSGSGVPSSGLGVDGEFYIDTDADTIYGPKTAGSWGSPTSLVGPPGAPGADAPDTLGGLTDVDFTTPPGDGEALVYDDDSGNWVPGAAGASAAGAVGDLQFNNGTGGLGASADLNWDDSGKVLDVGGDINLDDGGANQTTLQLVTPTAARTITFPDATGTVGLVAGSTTEAAYASLDGGFAGAVPFAWDGSFRVDGSFGYNPTDGVLSVRELRSITLTSPTIAGATTYSGTSTLTGRFICSVAGASNAPAGFFSGAWRVSGGDSTNTKPQVYIEQGSVTSNAWSTAGTGFGVNSNSTFAGRLADLQKNATSRWHVSSEGLVVTTQPAPAAVDTTATLTVANIQTGIVTTSTAAAVDMTLPTGTLMDGGIVGVQNDMATMWTVINTGPNTATLLDGVDHTIVGAAAVAADTSGRFVSRRTGTTTWVTYRVS